mgnify:CR=1 FL=1
MGGKGSGRKPGKKSGAAGTEGVSEAWDKVAAEAANDGKAKPSKAQGRLPLDADTEQIRTDIELPTPLNATEHAFVSAKVVDSTARIEELEKEIADYAKPRRKEIAELEKERTKLTREARTHARWGLVPCREVHRFRQRTVEVYRLDQGDPEEGVLVETRPMNAAELERATFEPPAGETIDLDDAGPSAEPVH